MLEKYIPKRFATAMLKHVIAVTLFFPYFYMKGTNPNYPTFLLVNVFIILAMVFICTSWKLEFKRNAIFVSGMSILLVAYNVCATYMNVKYHHWYGDQIHYTLAFLLFILLLMVKDIHALIDTSTIKATIHMIVASNVLAIWYRTSIKGNRLAFIKDNVFQEVYPEGLDKQFAWLYSHKCEYGLLLVLSIAFFVTQRKHFRNLFTYVLSLGVLLYALYLSDSYAALGASLLIFVGQFLDYLITAKCWKKLIAAFIIPAPIIWIVKVFLERLDTNRNILTLGGRTYIWNYFWEYIKAHPNGTEIAFGNFAYYIEGWAEWLVAVNNAHNVFLNHMLRFSLPVGSLFIALCMMIVLFSMKRNLSFTTPCIWGALFIPIMMDNSLTVVSLSYALVIVFLMFFIKSKSSQGTTP